MSAMTNYFESGILNQVFRGISLTLPSTGVYIGLTSDSPSESTPAANEFTTAQSGYARVHVATGNWTAPTADDNGHKVENNAAIDFPTADNNWGYASGVIITDALSGGNVLMKGDLTTPRNILDGDTFRFSSTDLDVKFD
jgi:hypothetical protein